MEIESDFNGLDEIIGLTLHKCYRKLLDDYNEELDLEWQDQELDGDTYLVFSNDKTVLFSAYTECFSVKFFLDKIIDLNEYKELSFNSFWEKRIGNKVIEISPLYSEHRSNPYGVRFVLSNDLSFDLVYVYDNEYTSDALVIKGK